MPWRILSACCPRCTGEVRVAGLASIRSACRRSLMRTPRRYGRVVRPTCPQELRSTSAAGTNCAGCTTTRGDRSEESILMGNVDVHKAAYAKGKYS